LFRRDAFILYLGLSHFVGNFNAKAQRRKGFCGKKAEGESIYNFLCVFAPLRLCVKNDFEKVLISI